MLVPSLPRARRAGLSLAGVLLIAAFAGAFGRVSAANLVVNGGFETGDLTGWTVYNEPGSAGNWFVYSGVRAPKSHLTIAAPPEGSFAAVADTNSPGSHELYQDIAVPANGKTTLSFYVYYANHSLSFFSPASLDFHTPSNQQYRVDLINPAAPILSVAPGDVLQNLFQTTPSSPQALAPTQITADLTPYAGATVRLRFAEVDNTGVLNASVDNVQVTAAVTVIPGTPQATLTIATTGCGHTTPGNTITVSLLANVVVTAVPCSGSTFTGWTGGPCNGTTTNPCDIGVGAPLTITANFAP